MSMRLMCIALAMAAASANESSATCTKGLNYTCNNPAADCTCSTMTGCLACSTKWQSKLTTYCDAQGDFKAACDAITGGGPAPGPSPGPGPGPSPATDDDESSSAKDPAAACPNATPSTSPCCFTNSTPAVLGGVDFVDLAGLTQGTGVPSFGSAEFTATLNKYTFHFKSAANAAIFKGSPWSYAPAWGGF